jgi:hypothetical protein
MKYYIANEGPTLSLGGRGVFIQRKKRRRKRKAKKHTDYHPVSFMFKLRKCQEKYKKSW